MDDTEAPPSSTLPEDEDLDASDEAPDFRLLYSTTFASSSSSHPTIPRRGEKDFEPHGTSTQQSMLDASLAAMIDTLSGLRVHQPKAHICARHDAEADRVVVENPRGQHFRTLGKTDERGQLCLAQEEFLYLLERGSLDGRSSRVDPGWSGVPSLPYSLQQTYATLSTLSLEAYTVYAALRRSGYVVFRAPDSSSLRHASDVQVKPSNRSSLSFKGICDRLLGSWLSRSKPFGTLVTPGLYRSIHDIQRILSIVPFHDARQTNDAPVPTQAPTNAVEHHGKPPPITNSSLLRVMFHIWKPRQGFRKSAPGTPDFQMAVQSTDESSCPKLWELDMLLKETLPASQPSTENAEGHVYSRLRNRHNSALIAVVDQGLISYVRFTDAQFGREKLYGRVGKGAGKKGGKGGSQRKKVGS